jgi:hypothetical protein
MIAVETGSGAMTYIPGFIKTGLGIQNLLGEIHIQTHTQQGNLKSLLTYFFFKIRKVD